MLGHAVLCRWASYSRYAFQATTQVELQHQQLACTAAAATSAVDNCPTGDTILASLHFPLDLTQNSLVLLGFFLGLQAIGAGVVYLMHR